MTSSADFGAGSPQLLSAHYDLLENVITDQLGLLAGRVVRILANHGALTLKELADALKRDPQLPMQTAVRAVRTSLTVSESQQSATASPALLTDAAVREIVTRLVLHRVMVETSAQVYRLSLGTGLLLRGLFPLVTQCVRRRYGEAGESVVLIVYQLAAVPLESAVRLAQERRPSLSEAIRVAAAQLVADGWLESAASVNAPTTSTTATAGGEHGSSSSREDGLAPDSTGRHGGQKRPREWGAGGGSAGGGNPPPSQEPCRLHLPAIQRALLQDAVQQLVSERYTDGGASTAVVLTLLHLQLPSPSVEDWPPLGPSTSAAAAAGAGVSSVTPVFSQEPLREYGFPAKLPPRTRPMAVQALLETIRRQRLHGVPGGDPAVSAHSAHHSPTAGSAGVPQRTSTGAGHATAAAAAALDGAIVSAVQRMLTRRGPTTGAPWLRSNHASSGAHHTSSSSSSSSPAASSLHHDGPELSGMDAIALQLDAVLTTLHSHVCERVVFARHGVLGVRLMKLLLQHRYLEDRTLAEEVIATPPKTREALHAMLRDGYVMQQEVPRSATLTERLPKNSVFLWGCSMQHTLLPAVREQLAKALANVLAKLTELHRVMDGATATANTSSSPLAATTAATTSTSAGSGEAAVSTGERFWDVLTLGAATSLRTGALGHEGGGKVSVEAVQRIMRAQRAIIGLQSSALALMRMLLIVDYYN